MITQQKFDEFCHKYPNLLTKKVDQYGDSWLGRAHKKIGTISTPILYIRQTFEHATGLIHTLDCTGVLSAADWKKLEEPARIYFGFPDLELDYDITVKTFVIRENSQDILTSGYQTAEENQINYFYGDSWLNTWNGRLSAVERFTPLLGMDRQGQNIYLKKFEHMLIAGATGSGKTAFTMQLILQIAKWQYQGFCTLHFVDRKRALGRMYKNSDELYPVTDPAAMHGLLYPPAIPFALDDFSAEAVLKYFTAIEEEMHYRQKILFEKGLNEFSVSGIDTHDRLMFIVIDEWADTIQSIAADPATRKIADQIKQKIFGITALGRSVGIVTIWISQRSDAEYFGGPTRANLTTRIAFKLPSENDYTLTFDKADLEKIDLDYIARQIKPGIGIVRVAGESPKIFRSIAPDLRKPYIGRCTGWSHTTETFYDNYLLRFYQTLYPLCDHDLAEKKFAINLWRDKNAD